MESHVAGSQLIPTRGGHRLDCDSNRVAECLWCAALAWGALAFGAVYPWAYWPLAAVCAAAGLARLRARDGWRLARGTAGLAIVMSAVAVAALGQLLPLPVSMLAQVSPRRAALLHQLDVNVAYGFLRTHALSIDPASTWRALALYVCFCLTALGVARCSTGGALRLTRFICWLGVAVALIGVIQKPLYAGALYGFWTPMTHGSPFGPFVNKNHFAGWAAMAIPLALGYCGAMLSRALATAHSGVRQRILWLSSHHANLALQGAFAAMVTAFALFLTLSRSGIVSLAAALFVCACIALWRHSASGRPPLAVACTVVALLIAVDFSGLDTLVARFDAADTAGLSGRIPIWRGTADMLRDFWGAGSGLNTYGVATLFYPSVVPAHHLREAHNDYLQLAVEGGALLGVPIFIAVTAFVLAVRRRCAASNGSAYWIRLGAVGGIVAVAVQSLVDFSLQMPGNAALFATLCGLALHEERLPSP